MGGESWHAIKKLFNPPFLILKVRHPAVTGVYCIVRDSIGVVVVMISNDNMAQTPALYSLIYTHTRTHSCWDISYGW